VFGEAGASYWDNCKTKLEFYVNGFELLDYKPDQVNEQDEIKSPEEEEPIVIKVRLFHEVNDFPKEIIL
jgi:hypothetical protein